ncbi:MAG: thioredoxin domain-containing protein [Planctomycetota bacterium]|nr:MAG: thioredoxin domain-containing protein [Planctomycetota bacterium]
MPNRLATESSPYLLQHQHNPVDWYPWGPEALARSKREDKPIFLSIGYSACHWCHVMEHESFENAEIAAAMNRDFVCVKVDREERPDLDQIYMAAVQAMTGRGGWPMSVFLTPALQPFYGGTYWPPRASRGMPGFDQILHAVGEAWRERREQVTEQAGELARHLQTSLAPPVADGDLDDALLHNAAAALERAFDFQYGGFGGAPKFPHAMDLMLLLRVWRRWPRDGILDMVRLTLDRMAAGGMYDQLGGGFARYSVDERWLVPHFEKMLYDNALLAAAYVEGYQALGDARYATIARETLDYLLRDMRDADGGFYSAEDADSEGEEGKFYVWTPDEIVAALGEPAAKTFCYVYDVTDEGNFDGHNILNLPKTLAQAARLLGREVVELAAELADSRAKLLAVRSKRVRPGLDDKVLASWNALAIEALAKAGAALDEPRYTEAAVRAASFVLDNLRREDGRLLHTWRRGQGGDAGVAKLDAYLDDYAYLANALITLYEATFDERWIDEAVRLAQVMHEHFYDRHRGGYFFTADDHEVLIAVHKDFQDQSVPSSNAMAATALARLVFLTDQIDFMDAVDVTLREGVGIMQQAPTAAAQLLIALDLYLGPVHEIAIVGDVTQSPTAEAIADLRRRFIPNKVVACRAEPGVGSRRLAPLFANKPPADEPPGVYVCQDRRCNAPVFGLAAALEAWQRLAQAANRASP